MKLTEQESRHQPLGADKAVLLTQSDPLRPLAERTDKAVLLTQSDPLRPLAERTSHSFAFSPLSVSHVMKSLSCARDNRLGVYLLSDLFSTAAFVTNPVCVLGVCTVSAVASQPETIV